MATAEDDLRHPRETFLAWVKPEFMRALFELLRREYPKAKRECEHLPDPQAKYLYPHVRRANIEAGLMDLAQRVPGARVEAVPNETGECHVEMSFGPVCLAVSHVDHPSRLVRDARFRRNRAEDNQGLLFDSGSRPAPGARLFALALHGPNTLDFVDIVFPIPSDEEEDGICYHSDRIHLARMFNDKPGENEGPAIRKEPEVG